MSYTSPSESLYQIKPDYSTLKVFCRQCFLYIRPYNKHKLEFWSQSCTFLRYIGHYKGYKCLGPDGRLHISCHVVFDEDVFPYRSKNSSSTGNAPLSNPSNPLVSLQIDQNLDQLANTKPKISSPLPTPNLPHVLIPQSPTLEDSPQNAPTPDNLSPIAVQREHQTNRDIIETASSLAGNRHHLTTRSKSGIFKPKAYLS